MLVRWLSQSVCVSLTIAALCGSAVGQETPSGWTWTRWFDVISANGTRTPAEGTATIHRLEPTGPKSFFGDDDSSLAAPILGGKLVMPLPLAEGQDLSLLWIEPDEASPVRFAPHLSFFGFGPIEAAPEGGGAILEMGQITTPLRAMEPGLKLTPDKVGFYGIVLQHPLFNGTGPNAAPIDVTTAEVFARSNQGRTTGPQASPGGVLSTGGASSGVIDGPVVGGLYIETATPIDSVFLGIPPNLPPAVGGAACHAFQLIDMESGERIQEGLASPSIPLSFDGGPTSQLLLVLYGKNILFQPESDECECQKPEDAAGNCEVSMDCVLRKERLTGMGIDLCYEQDGEFGPPIPGSSSTSVSVASSKTLTETTSSSHKWGASVSIEKKLGLWKVQGTGSYEYLVGSSKAVSTHSSTTNTLTLVSGQTLAVRWMEITCHWECVTYFGHGYGHYDPASQVTTHTNMVSCDSDVAVENCSEFSPGPGGGSSTGPCDSGGDGGDGGDGDGGAGGG